MFLEPSKSLRSQHFGIVSFLILIVQKKDMHIFEDLIIRHHLEKLIIKPLPVWLLRKPFSRSFQLFEIFLFILSVLTNCMANRYYSSQFRKNYEGFSQVMQFIVLLTLIYQFFCLLPISIQNAFWSMLTWLSPTCFRIVTLHLVLHWRVLIVNISSEFRNLWGIKRSHLCDLWDYQTTLRWSSLSDGDYNDPTFTFSLSDCLVLLVHHSCRFLHSKDFFTDLCVSWNLENVGTGEVYPRLF